MALKPEVPKVSTPAAVVQASFLKDTRADRARKKTGKQSLVSAGRLETKAKTVKSSLLGT